MARSFLVDDERYGFETYNVPSGDWNPPLSVRSMMRGVCVLGDREFMESTVQLDVTAGNHCGRTRTISAASFRPFKALRRLHNAARKRLACARRKVAVCWAGTRLEYPCRPKDEMRGKGMKGRAALGVSVISDYLCK